MHDVPLPLEILIAAGGYIISAIEWYYSRQPRPIERAEYDLHELEEHRDVLKDQLAVSSQEREHLGARLTELDNLINAQSRQTTDLTQQLEIAGLKLAAAESARADASRRQEAATQRVAILEAENQRLREEVMQARVMEAVSKRQRDEIVARFGLNGGLMGRRR